MNNAKFSTDEIYSVCVNIYRNNEINNFERIEKQQQQKQSVSARKTTNKKAKFAYHIRFLDNIKCVLCLFDRLQCSNSNAKKKKSKCIKRKVHTHFSSTTLIFWYQNQNDRLYVLEISQKSMITGLQVQMKSFITKSRERRCLCFENQVHPVRPTPGKRLWFRCLSHFQRNH